MKKFYLYLLIFGFFCLFILSWISLWFALVGFILIGFVMLLSILEPVIY